MSAPTPVITGTSGAYLQPGEGGFDSSGGFWIERWHGTRAAIQGKIDLLAIRALTQGIPIPPYNWRRSPSGANDQLEIRYTIGPGQIEQPQVVWEIRYNPLEKDILRSDVARGLTDNERTGLKEYMSNPSADTLPASDPGSVYEQLIALVKSGETSVLEFAPTLTRTITIGTESQVRASQTNIRRIIRSASMFGVEGFPNDLVFSLPTDADPAPTPEDIRILSYGWMKEGPNVTRIANQKTSIQQNWIYGLWPQAVYGIPI